MYCLTKNESYHIRCTRDFDKRRAGDEYMIHGPLTYRHRIEETIVRKCPAIINQSGHALRLRAR